MAKGAGCATNGKARTMGDASMTPQQINQELFDACLEALALFNDYPECYKSIGTHQVLNIAINNALKEMEATA
jgi:hypothetical protein